MSRYKTKLLGGALIAVAAAIAGCERTEDRGATLRKDTHGMVIGDDRQSQPLVVGVGDTVARLEERNSFLKQLRLGATRSDELLRLPLMTKLDLRYEVRFTRMVERIDPRRGAYEP